MKRSIEFYGDEFMNFYHEQEEKVQRKIEYVLDLIRHEQHVPVKFYKLLRNTGGIYEIRVVTSLKNIRILCFPEGNNLIVLLSAFVKKTQKTPKNEIKRAQILRERYLTEKDL